MLRTLKDLLPAAGSLKMVLRQNAEGLFVLTLVPQYPTIKDLPAGLETPKQQLETPIQFTGTLDEFESVAFADSLSALAQDRRVSHEAITQSVTVHDEIKAQIKHSEEVARGKTKLKAPKAALPAPAKPAAAGSSDDEGEDDADVAARTLGVGEKTEAVKAAPAPMDDLFGGAA